MSQQFFTSLIEKGEFRVTEQGHLQVLNELMFLVPSPVMVHMYHRSCEGMGEEDAAVFFREMGRFQVEQAAERYVDQYNFDEMSKRKIMDFTSKVIKIIGFGDIEFSAFDRENQTATVKLAESVFAARYRDQYGDSDHPVDHWLAGILEKHFGVIFGVEAEAEEVSCEAQGDKNCVFEISVID